MDDICVTFEEWYLGDGTYPPLHRGQKVNLSFYIFPYEKRIAAENHKFFRQIKNSDYSFSGEIIRNYADQDYTIIIVDTGSFKFYIELRDNSFFPIVGQYITGEGRLLVDYYIWVENLNNYENPPDIFYNFIVDKIRKVEMPEKFIYRDDKSYSAPTSLPTSDYNDKDVIEIEDMQNDKGEASFYLLDLRQISENIPRTFT